MDYWRTIRQGNFARLWGSQILSQVAQNLLNFALIINVFNAASGTRFANISVSLLVLAFGVPSIFFATMAGTLVDRWNRRLVMLGCNVARGILVLLYIPFHHSLAMILALTFLISTITQFFIPAESAMIPQVVPKKYLLMANSLFVFSIYTSFIVGYAVAAPVLSALGEFGPYLVTGTMFGLAGLALLGLPRDHHTRDTGLVLRLSFWQEVRTAFQIIRSDRWLALAIRQLTVTQAIVSVILTLAPALSLSLLHRPLQSASQYLIIPAGLGMVLGVIVVGRLVRRWSKIRVLELGLVIAGAALSLLGLSKFLYQAHRHGHSLLANSSIALIVAILVFALGMLNAIISSTAQTVLQENSTEEARGKVFGSLSMFINIAATLPILITGALADLLSVTNVVIVMGVAVVLFAVYQLMHLHPTHSRTSR